MDPCFKNEIKYTLSIPIYGFTIYFYFYFSQIQMWEQILDTDFEFTSCERQSQNDWGSRGGIRGSNSDINYLPIKLIKIKNNILVSPQYTIFNGLS